MRLFNEASNWGVRSSWTTEQGKGISGKIQTNQGRPSGLTPNKGFAPKGRVRGGPSLDRILWEDGRRQEGIGQRQVMGDAAGPLALARERTCCVQSEPRSDLCPRGWLEGSRGPEPIQLRSTHLGCPPWTFLKWNRNRQGSWLGLRKQGLGCPQVLIPRTNIGINRETPVTDLWDADSWQLHHLPHTAPRYHRPRSWSHIYIDWRRGRAGGHWPGHVKPIPTQKCLQLLNTLVLKRNLTPVSFEATCCLRGRESPGKPGTRWGTCRSGREEAQGQGRPGEDPALCSEPQKPPRFGSRTYSARNEGRLQLCNLWNGKESIF